MESGTANERYVELLLDKIRGDRYPSGQLMDRIEGALQSREQAQEYFELLEERVQQSRYPSHQLLDRLERLSALTVRG